MAADDRKDGVDGAVRDEEVALERCRIVHQRDDAPRDDAGKAHAPSREGDLVVHKEEGEDERDGGNEQAEDGEAWVELNVPFETGYRLQLHVHADKVLSIGCMRQLHG